MKIYLVFDSYSEYQELMSYKDIKQLLIEELEEDTLENNDDKSIVKHNFSVMKKLTEDKYIPNTIITELESFGWIVKDLTDLQELLTDFQVYKYGLGAPSYPNDCIEQTLKMIEEEMK